MNMLFKLVTAFMLSFFTPQEEAVTIQHQPKAEADRGVVLNSPLVGKNADSDLFVPSIKVAFRHQGIRLKDV